MGSNLDIYNSLASVPDWAKKKIKGGDISGMTDISPQWRIKAMTEKFGVIGIGWYYEVTNKWLECHDTTVCAFVDINLYIKNGDKWSMPISGTGGNIFARYVKGKGDNTGYTKVSDECYKMATTDALSVAMKQLGVGADVYSGFEDSKYRNPSTQQPPNIQDNREWFNPKDKQGNITPKGKSFIEKAKKEGREVVIKQIKGFYQTSKMTDEWMNEVELK